MKLKQRLALVMAAVLMLTSVNFSAVEAFASDFLVTEETLSEALAEEPESVTSEAVYETDMLLEEEADAIEAEAADSENEITVTFDANGGVFDNGESQQVVSGYYGERLSSLPMNPEMGDGFAFTGWYYEAEALSPVDLSTYVLEEDVTFFAGFESEIAESEDAAEAVDAQEADVQEEDELGATVYYTIDANGGVFPNGELTINITSKTKGLSSSSYKPTLAGKRFKGWYAEKECTTLLSNSYDPDNNDIYYLKDYPAEGATIYAGWADCYVLTYVFGNETGTDPLKDTGFYYDTTYNSETYQQRVKKIQYLIPVGKKINSNYYPNNTYYIGNEDRHYAFDAWYRDEDRTTKIGTYLSETPTADTTYYAGFADKKYVLTFKNIDDTAYFTQQSNLSYESNNSNGRYDTYYYVIDKNYSFYSSNIKYYAKNDNPRRGFVGVYTDNSGNDPLEVNSYGNINVTKDMDLYIKWDDTNYVVTFDANGGFIYDSKNKKDQSHGSVQKGFEPSEYDSYIGGDVYLKNKDLHKRFIGWSTDAKSTEPEYEYSSTYDSEYAYKQVTIKLTGDLTLYAIWEDAYNVVTFKAGNGSFRYYDILLGDYVENATEATIRTKDDGFLRNTPDTIVSADDNYVFESWQYGDDKIDNNDLYSYEFTEDTTLTANYTKIYTITVDAKGGSFKYYDYEDYETHEGATSIKVKTRANGTLNANIYDPTIDNDKKTFEGWYIGNTKIDDLDEYVFTEDTTIEAHYVDVYTITVDAKGGTFRYYSYELSQYVDDAKTATFKTKADGTIHGSVYEPKSADDKKVFDGWYNGTELIESFYSYVFTKDTTIEAHYIDVYTITVDAKGGKFKYYDSEAGKYIEDVEKVEFKTGKGGAIRRSIYDPEIDDKNKIFDAWYVGKTKIDYLYDYAFTGNATVEAHYKAAYTVTLNANGGYFSNGNDKPETKDLRVAEGEETWLDTPRYTDNAKEFGGWYTDKDTWKDPVGNYITPTKNITLYARWLDKCTVTFELGEGKINGKDKVTYTVVENSTFGSNNSMPSDPVPESESRAFAGWYTDKELNNKIERDEVLSFVVTKDTTFYAKYANAYLVTFNSNGGSFVKKDGNTYKVRVAEGESLKGKYPSVKSTQEKVFRGWFTDKDCKNAVENIYSYVPTQDTVLYAGFTECYILTFHANHQGAKLDGSTAPVKVKVTKGDAYRYGKDSATKDVLFSAPKLTYDGITDALPVSISYGSSITAGWSENENGSGNIYYFGTSNHCYETEDGTTYYYNMYGFIPTRSMELYAVWGKPVTVTFDANGGKFLDNEWENEYTTFVSETERTVTVASGTRYGKLHTPYDDSDYMVPKEGFTDCSWGYTDAACKKYIGYYTKITADTRIYASWYKSSGGGSSEEVKAKELTLHSGKGYFGSRSTTTYTVEYVLSATNTNYARVPDIDDIGLAFSGWYYDEALTKRYPDKYQIKREKDNYWYIIIPEEVTDLYAGFDAAYTLTFDANGGYFDKDKDRTKDPSNLKDDTIVKAKQKLVGGAINVSDITKRVRRDGDKVFVGWYTDKALTKRAAVFSDDSNDEYFIPTANTTLYAKWAEYALPTIKVDTTEITLDEGKTKQLTATVEPATQTENIHWYVNNYSLEESNNQDIHTITITTDGLVTANVPGTATVYAEFNGVRSDLIKITVPGKNVETTIKVSPTTVNLSVDDTATVSATVTPSKKAGSVSWSSKDTKVATVTGSGSSAVIKAVGKGETKVVAKVDNKTAEVTVKVSEKVEAITLSAKEMVLTSNEGVTGKLTATLAPVYADKKVVWTTSDAKVATVTADANDSKIAIVDPADDLEQAQEVVIKATIDGTDKSAECKVTVSPLGGVLDPYADVAEGTVQKGTLVTLATDTPGADIFYTTDGTNPGTKAEGATKKFTDAIEIENDMTIKALAYKEGLKVSSVVTFVYTVDKDWGDIDEDSRGKWFNEDFDKIPADVWFVFDGVRYEQGALNVVATYTGESITFNDKITVFHNTRKLVENRDYEVAYRNNVNAAAANAAKAPTVVIKGKGGYSSVAEFAFEIKADDINNAEITSEKDVAVITGKTKLSATKPVISYKGKKLTQGKDYELKFFDGATEVNAASVVLNDATKVYTIKVLGQGNFAGTMKDTISVQTLEQKAEIVPVSKLKVGDNKGKAITEKYAKDTAVDIVKKFDNSQGNENATAFVKDGNKILVFGTDFTVEALDDDNTSAGKHSFVVKGIKKPELADGQKNYIGEKVCTYEIKGVDLKKVKVAGFKTAVEFTGSEITLDDLFNKADKNLKADWKAVTLYSGKKGSETALVKDVDYTVEMSNTGALGKFNVVFTGKGGYTGTIKKVVTVKAHKVPASQVNITFVGGDKATFVKTGAKPEVTVKVGDTELVQGTDFTVSYKNNAKVSSAASVVIKGIGNYAGTTASKNFTVEKANIKQVSVVAKDVVYKKGKAGYFLATPKLMDDGKALTIGKGKDVEKLAKDAYEFTYLEDTVLESGETKVAGSKVEKTDKVKAGTTIAVTVTVSCSNKSPYYVADDGKLVGYFRIVEKDLSKAKIEVTDKSKLAVNAGEAVKLTKSDLKVTVSKAVLGADDYDLTITENKAARTVTVTIRGRGNYGGTKSQTFKLTAKGLK